MEILLNGEGVYMDQKNNLVFDWRDVAAFDYTNHFNKQDWAWEFLRANPKYKDDYNHCTDGHADIPTTKTGIGAIKVNHQTASDLKAGEWGLLNFR